MVKSNLCFSCPMPLVKMTIPFGHSSDILPIFSNIRVLYVFLGIFKNTWKYLIQRPIFKPLYNYNAFLKILENTSFWAPSKNTHISYVTTMLLVNVNILVKLDFLKSHVLDYSAYYKSWKDSRIFWDCQESKVPLMLFKYISKSQ